MEPKKVKLKYPFEYGSEMVTEAVFTRRANAEDMELMPVPTDGASSFRMKDFFPCLCNLLGWEITRFRKLDAEDLIEIFDVFESFLPDTLTTGGNR